LVLRTSPAPADSWIAPFLASYETSFLRAGHVKCDLGLSRSSASDLGKITTSS
jgi:hypothetical protein